MPIILGVQLPSRSLFVLHALGVKGSLDQAPQSQTFSKALPPPPFLVPALQSSAGSRCPQVATVPWGRMTVPQWLGGRPWLGALGVRDEIYGCPWDVGDCRGAQNLGFGGDPFGAQARARGEAVSSSSRGPGHWQSGSGGVKGAESSSSSHLQNPSVVSFTERGRGWSQGHLAGVRRLTDDGGGGGLGGQARPPRSFSQLRRSWGTCPLPTLPPGDREAPRLLTLPAPPQARRLGPGVQGAPFPSCVPVAPPTPLGLPIDVGVPACVPMKFF